ncbi:MAG: zinc-dependent metalloprotease [Acholeplasmataceae bacterium]|nr:zinc-dependent metalloprotease [Acholeplasmataceae bacterium]
MKKNIILFIIIFFSSILTAQQRYCGTKPPDIDPYTIPYYGNSKFINEISTLINKRSDKTNFKSAILEYYEDEGAWIDLPLKIIIHRDFGGNNAAMSDADAIQLLQGINLALDNTDSDIRLYLKCEIQHVDNTNVNNSLDTDQQFEDMFGMERDPKAVNLHILRNDANSTSSSWLTGRAVFPFETNDKSFAILTHPEIGVDNMIDFISTAVHELGHVFNLRHTHMCDRCDPYIPNKDASKCFQESVSRSKTNGILCVSTYNEVKCEINGDYLCSTDASPGALWWEVNEITCAYTTFWEDKWNEYFAPQVNNFMQYTYGNCRDLFTDEQHSIMNLYAFMLMYEDLNNGTYEFYYNSDILSASGEVLNGETNDIIVSRKLIVPRQGETFIARSGSEVSLQTQENIILRNGFRTLPGATFSAHVGPITNCDDVTFYRQSDDGDPVEMSNILMTSNQNNSALENTKAIENVVTNTLKEQMIKKSLHNELNFLWDLDSSIVIKNMSGEKDLSTLVSEVKDDFSTYLPGEMYVYPNPAKDILYINSYIDDSNSDLLLRIFDISGKLVLSKVLYKESYDYSVGISSLKQGVYNYIISSNEKVYTGILKKE